MISNLKIAQENEHIFRNAVCQNCIVKIRLIMWRTSHWLCGIKIYYVGVQRLDVFHEKWH